MKAKILILEERLKMKMEVVFEKELINEELDTVNHKYRLEV